LPNIQILKPTSITNTIFLLCCLAVLIFPFSVAATNTLFAIAVLFSLFSGNLKQGAIMLWKKQSFFTKSLLFYLSLLVIGLLWSSDLKEGLKDVVHNSKWIILPLLLSVLRPSKQHFMIFYAALSLGLTIHLFFCVAQMFDLIDISGVAGSSKNDATGYIGHISFGIVYSIWAACLILWGSQQHHYTKWIAFLIAAWSFTMVFLAQGRSGFIIAITVILYLSWHFIFRNKGWKFILPILLVIMVSTFFVAQKLVSHPRAQQTLQSIQAIYDGDLSQAELRVFLWKSALDIWQQNPMLGVGTGSYKNSVIAQKDTYPMLVQGEGALHAHPHNLYLLTAARFGTVGLVALCLLLWSWFRIGTNTQNIYLKFASVSALALTAHSFTSIGLEEYQAISMLIFALSASISKS